MDTLDVSDSIRIPMAEIQISAVRSQGSGGQNVNKVETAIHLRFDAQNCSALPEWVKARLLQLRDQRITSQGLVIVKSQAHRSRERNRAAALTRLKELLRRAAHKPKRRIATRPSRASNRKRLDNKNKRGQLKRSRQRHFDN